MQLADLCADLAPTLASQALVAFRNADDGSHNAVRVLQNLEGSIAKLRSRYKNPNSLRNYLRAMKAVAELPPVAAMLGSSARGAVERLSAELAVLNRDSYRRRKGG